MRNYEFDPAVLVQSRAANARAHKAPKPVRAKAPKVYDLEKEYTDPAADGMLDAILAGYGVGRGERLVLTDCGGAVECETLDPWWEQ